MSLPTELVLWLAHTRSLNTATKPRNSAMKVTRGRTRLAARNQPRSKD